MTEPPRCPQGNQLFNPPLAGVVGAMKDSGEGRREAPLDSRRAHSCFALGQQERGPGRGRGGLCTIGPQLLPIPGEADSFPALQRQSVPKVTMVPRTRRVSITGSSPSKDVYVESPGNGARGLTGFFLQDNSNKAPG